MLPYSTPRRDMDKFPPEHIAINEDTARVCIEAAVEMRAPLILDFAYQFHPDIVSLGKIICMLAQTAAVPIAVNLDHGASFEQAIWAIRAGFTSIMVDRSSAPYEDNIRDTAELVKIAHAVGVSVDCLLYTSDAADEL